MHNVKIRFLSLLFSIFIITNFLIFSGLFDSDSPVAVVNKYYSALQTLQYQLTFRELEEFDWKAMPSIFQKSIYRIYGRFFNLHETHGLIKSFKIIYISISHHLAEVHLQIKWSDGNEAIDKVKLSNKTGKWKIVSAEIYY